MANFSNDFTLETQSAFGDDLTIGNVTGVATANIENRLEAAVGIATANLENRIHATGVATANIQNELNYRTGIATALVENKVYQIGSVSATIENEIFLAGIATAVIENILNYRTGIASMAFRNNVFDVGTPTVTIENAVTARTGATSVIIQNEVYEAAATSVSIENRLQAATLGKVWKAVIMLNGVDMTARQSGAIDIEIDEGGARICSFQLLPFSGVIDPYDWIGVDVTVDYLTYDSSGIEQSNHRLFTGVVDEPIYDPTTRFTTFECTDNLQEYFESKEFTQIDSVIGGYHSDVVFGETEDRWEYAQQRLSSQPASFDFDVYGNGRLTAWQAKATSDLSFSSANIIHESLGLKLISRRDVVNTVNIKLGYRFGRKWQREIGGGWHYPRPFYQFLSDQTTLPNRDMILSSLDAGWDIKSIFFTKLPPSGQYVNSEGAQTTWGISDELRDYLVFGVGFTLAKKWLQDVTEDYSIQVTAAASIAKHGEIKADEFYALDDEVEEEFEQVSETATISSTSSTDSSIETGRSFGYTEPEVGGVDVGDYDTIVDPTDRAEFDNAVKTAIAEARTHILRTHRANTVVIQDLLVPDADTHKTADVATSEVTAKGKVRRVAHSLDTSTGEALSTIELSLYQPNTAGQTDDAIAVPPQANTTPNIDTTGLSLGTHIGGRTTTKYSEDWTGFIGNWTSARTFPSEWYPNEFRVDIPAIEDDARDAQEFTATSVFNTAIPQDILTINA
jgi:hypothetical protein